MQLPTETLYLAMDTKTHLHCLLRFLPKNALDEPLGKIGVDEANGLLMAKNPEDLVKAAEQLGPMSTRVEDLGDRLLTVQEVQEESGARFRPSDPLHLLSECFFDPYATSTESNTVEFERTGRITKISAKRAVKEYDFCANASWESMKEYLCVVIEPLQDWLLLRNLLSIVLRLGSALVKNGNESTVLEDAGFSRVDGQTLEQKLGIFDIPRGFVIPTMVNPYFQTDVGMALTTPLCSLLASKMPKYNDYSIRFAAPSQSAMAIPEESGWLYAVIEAREDQEQKDLANKFLDVLDRTLYDTRLTFSGVRTREVSLISYNLPTSLWELVRNHPGHYLMTCEYCHRTMLAHVQGGLRRKYCGGSCSVMARRSG